MSKLKLYCAWFCPFAQRAWIALLEKGVPFEYIEYNPYAEKTPEFLKLNPRGLVPVLEVGGKSVYESDVCLEFIDEYGGIRNPLLPSNPLERAKIRIVSGFINREIVPLYYSMLLKQDLQVQDKIKSEMLINLKLLMKFKNDSDTFFSGEYFGMADIMLAPFAMRFPVLEYHRGFTIPKTDEYKSVNRWLDACRVRPSVVKTLPEDRKNIMIYQSYADGSAAVRSKL